MTEPPKRRAWLQLHLSTCVVLMCVAGALVWGNLTPYIILRKPPAPVSAPNLPIRDDGYECYGWPLPFIDGYAFYNGHIDPAGNYTLLMQLADNAPPVRNYSLPGDIWRHPERWSKTNLIANVGVALLLLILCTACCESLLRRRERKRAAQPDP